ncbi:hypothetical protein [Pectobacterium zantedeschiae]|uniref:Uncharacterized protein n=1 Tax=Pectobacterium zantedeschiae TaxID=2034769 RepID=A0A9X8JL56_9GAMM|nr:hypothetical protein [Pectobacterium zantedeschiae]RYC44327.1 hypothetical protein CLR69_04635 [Pectobacterium zantedeschiae]RYC49486.1 hypothetical protein CTN06_00435 [Pectobacterium zantedeschiae]
MDAQKFINVLNTEVRDAAVEDTISILESPPGRKPAKELIELSVFYNQQTEENKFLINKIIKYVADDAVFGMLCVLDGVRAIEDDNKGDLVLNYQNTNGVSVALNASKDLHDIFNAS